VAVALLAAWRASQQPPPAVFALRHSGELDRGLQDWLRASARANSWAAQCTAVVPQAASDFWH